MRLAYAAAAVLLAGCTTISDACTLIFCESGLTVQLAQAPVGAYRIEVFTPSGGTHHVFDCADPAQCGEARFVDYMPPSVTIRVTTSAGTREQTTQPTYNTSRPNGPGCGPECKQATVTVPLPG
jgi:hypothetical protein